MTNLKAKINANGYLWLEGNFNYYDDTNPTTITIEKPPVINEVDISAYETWVEIIRVFNNQTSRDFGQAVNNIYVINENNPKGTILTIKVYFINPISEDEIATNEVNIQFGINKRSGILPPSVIPETKILDKAFTDFIIIGRNIDFYNVSGLKVSSGTFSDLATSGDLNSKPDKSDLENYTRNATIKIAAYDATAKSKASSDYVCDSVADEVEINAAIASLDGIGGCIELSEGTFYLESSIYVNSGIWLKGQGVSTILFGYDTFATAVDFFQEDEATGIPSKITDLCITNCSIGVRIANFRTVYVEGCTIYGCNLRAISVAGTATVTNCEIVDNTGYGVWVSSLSGNNLIAHNRFENNTTGNISDSSTGSIIANNVEITGGEV